MQAFHRAEDPVGTEGRKTACNLKGRAREADSLQIRKHKTSWFRAKRRDREIRGGGKKKFLGTTKSTVGSSKRRERRQSYIQD